MIPLRVPRRPVSVVLMVPNALETSPVALACMGDKQNNLWIDIKQFKFTGTMPDKAPAREENPVATVESSVLATPLKVPLSKLGSLAATDSKLLAAVVTADEMDSTSVRMAAASDEETVPAP